VYDGNPRTVTRFLDTLTCPDFTYDNVLSCQSALVGAKWSIPLPDIFSDSDSVDLPEDGIGNLRKQAAALIAADTALPRPPPRRCPHKWEESEVDALVRGIARYGLGHWAEIRADYAHEFDRHSRKPADLRLKHRAMVRQGLSKI
jgi:hypothetical protein